MIVMYRVDVSLHMSNPASLRTTLKPYMVSGAPDRSLNHRR